MKKFIFSVLLLLILFTISYENSISQTTTIPCDRYSFNVYYNGCTFVLYICVSRGPSGVVKVTYDKVYYYTTPPCDSISFYAFQDPNFWNHIDNEVIKHMAAHGYYPPDCANGGGVLYYDISKTPCQKMVYNANTTETYLQPCNETYAECLVHYITCVEYINGIANVKVTRLGNDLYGNVNCSNTASPTMHPTVLAYIYETDCFAIGCN